MNLNAVKQKLPLLDIFESLLLTCLNALVIQLAQLALVGTWSFFLFSVSKAWLQNELLNLTSSFKQPGVFGPNLLAFRSDLYLNRDCEAESDGQSNNLTRIRKFELHANLFHLITNFLYSSLNSVYELTSGNFEFLLMQVLAV